MTDLSLCHAFDRHVELRRGEQVLWRYVYHSPAPRDESPRPYFHPLCTLAGYTLSTFRPHDHRWHHGLSMTVAELSGQNFWGGPTFVRGQGYQRLDNHGQVRHAGWQELACADWPMRFAHRLTWTSRQGETWIDELRSVTMVDVDLAQGFYALSVTMELANVRGQDLRFGSPTTEGRADAGYGGLFWRGPREFRDGLILADQGRTGPQLMGQRSRWLAYQGRHDGADAGSTLLMVDDPANPRHPTQWFVRREPYACASAAFMFDEPCMLPAGQTLRLRYHMAIIDGHWPADQLDALALRLAPTDRPRG